MNELTQSSLKERLIYDPETGIFVWLDSLGGVKLGSVCGHVNNRGYVRITIDGRRHRAHRLAWLYVYGKFPRDQIDHIDGNPSNNKMSNLRECTGSENSQNARIRKDKKLRIKNVYFHKKSGRYRVQVTSNKRRYEKVFDVLEDAAADALRARKEMHGQFARHG